MRSALIALLAIAQTAAAQASFTMEQVKSYPFPNALTASATGSRIAWALNEQGRRNVWVADGPDFRPRQLTRYDVDDGQEITSLQVTRDGKWVVFLRGGDFSSNWDDATPVNVRNLPTPPKVQIVAVPFEGGDAKLIGEGEEPVVSPSSDRLAFVRDRAIWIAPIDGSAPARRAIAVRGDNGSVQWSPDGSKIAFVSNRQDHAFIGIYVNDSLPMQWIDPTTSRDGSPRWSPDGTHLAFVRRPGAGGPDRFDPHAAPQSVGGLDRRYENRNGAAALEESRNAARVGSHDSRGNEPALGGGGTHRFPVVHGRLAAPVLDLRKRRRAPPAHPRPLHGRVHLAQRRRSLPRIRGERRVRRRRHRSSPHRARSRRSRGA